MSDRIPFVYRVLPLAAAGLLAGCAATVSPQPEWRAETHPRLTGTQAAAERYDINGQWWQIYRDPQLDQLLARALADNIDLRQAAVSVNRALYQANILGAKLVPAFNGSAGVSISRNLDSGSSSRTFSSQLGLSYELDLWRKLSAQADAQVWAYRAGREDLANVRLTLVNNVSDAYFHLGYLNARIALAEQSLAHYREIGRIAQAQYRHGKVSSADPTQAARSELAAQNQILSLQSSRNAVVQTLRNLLNLPPDEPLPLDEAAVRLPENIPEVDLDVPLSVLANRPDVRAAEYRLQAALSNQEAQYRSWFPTITVGAGLSASANRAGAVFDVPFLGGSVQVNLPFLAWNTLKWQDKTAEAEFESARLSFEQTLTAALNEVDGYYRQYRINRANETNLRQALVLAQKNSRYYEARYRYGKNSLSDWLGARNGEEDSAQNLLAARYERLKYANMVYKAMAGRYTPK
ncbi:TolC family protein [Neisseria leonii]|uniref:TolC family protein n=1 Tax=Neisseria leonii TaxID=2995413 RepID=A0A9X4EAC0_9NEIS|nr:TolC family protein [Neisseria sp. 51.81]MDD9328328.1 TolC family protein [Neisseria sp. 51.81]